MSIEIPLVKASQRKYVYEDMCLLLRQMFVASGNIVCFIAQNVDVLHSFIV